MFFQLVTGGRYPGDRDSHRQRCIFRMRGINLQCAFDTAKQAEIIIEAQMIEPPSDQRMRRIGAIGSGGYQ